MFLQRPCCIQEKSPYIFPDTLSLFVISDTELQSNRQQIMASNGHGGGHENILVLYKVVNSETDSEDDYYNAFHMPGGRSITLAAVKQ